MLLRGAARRGPSPPRKGGGRAKPVSVVFLRHAQRCRKHRYRNIVCAFNQCRISSDKVLNLKKSYEYFFVLDSQIRWIQSRIELTNFGENKFKGFPENSYPVGGNVAPSECTNEVLHQHDGPVSRLSESVSA